MEVVTDFTFCTEHSLDMIEVPFLSRSGNKVRFVQNHAAFAMVTTTSERRSAFVANDRLRLNNRQLVSA